MHHSKLFLDVFPIDFYINHHFNVKRRYAKMDLHTQFARQLQVQRSDLNHDHTIFKKVLNLLTNFPFLSRNKFFLGNSDCSLRCSLSIVICLHQKAFNKFYLILSYRVQNQTGSLKDLVYIKSRDTQGYSLLSKT